MTAWGHLRGLQDHLQELLVRHLHPAVSVGIRALKSFGERFDDHAASDKAIKSDSSLAVTLSGDCTCVLSRRNHVFSLQHLQEIRRESESKLIECIAQFVPGNRARAIGIEVAKCSLPILDVLP